MRAIRRMAVIDTRKMKQGDRYVLLFDIDVSVSIVMASGEINGEMVNVKAGVEFTICNYDVITSVVRCMPVRSNEFAARLKVINKKNISGCSVYFSTDAIEQYMRKTK